MWSDCHIKIFILFLSIIHFYLDAQPLSDSINNIYRLQEEGNLKLASRQLESLIASNKDDYTLYWLYAQNEYWQKNGKKSRVLYNRAYELNPDNVDLKLDRIEKHLYMGQFKRSSEFIGQLSAEDKKNTFTSLLHARLKYWTGDFEGAEAIVQKFNKVNNADIEQLELDIKSAKAPWVSVQSHYYTDSQPLEAFVNNVSGGFYKSSMLSLQASMTHHIFNLDDRSLSNTFFTVSNSMRISSTGSSIDYSTGAAIYNSNQIFLTGKINADLKIAPGLSWRPYLSKAPYLFTIASVTSPVVPYYIGNTLEWKPFSDYWFNLGNQFEFFDDRNYIQNYWGWGFLPSMGIEAFSFRVGAGVSYSDADKSSFTPTRSLEDIISDWQIDGTAITGMYEPYFSPHSMLITNLLFQGEYKFSNLLSLYFNGSYSVWARADNPYLFLNFNENNQLVIHTGFEPTKFTPFTFDAKLQLSLPRSFLLELNYQRQRIFFFDQSTAGVTLKKRFI